MIVKTVLVRLIDVGDEIDTDSIAKKFRKEFRIFRQKYTCFQKLPLVVESKEGDVSLAVKIYSVGVVSIVASISKTVDLVRLVHKRDDIEKLLARAAEDRMKKIHEMIKGDIVKPSQSIESEEYIVYCVKNKKKAKDIFEKNKRKIAAILREEKDYRRLSSREVADATKNTLSYYDNDIMVVDWGSAFIIDPKEDWDESLFIVEMANMQLLEFKVYDKVLDSHLNKLYDDLSRKKNFLHLLRTLALERKMTKISKHRIDSGEVVEEVMNSTKFIQEWYLLKLYDVLSNSLRLQDWKESLEKKEETLENAYSTMLDRARNTRIEVLEVVMVLLIVADMVLYFL